MMAHSQGGLLNASTFARGLGIDSKTVARYLDLLVDLLLVRRLEPWHRNVGKRLVKSPRIYIRDSGIVHTLLGLDTVDDVLSHPVVGSSWEGFVIEQILNQLQDRFEASFYRSAAGAEIDLVLRVPGNETWAIEVKRSMDPRPEKGFYHACEVVDPDRRFTVHPGLEQYPLSPELTAIPLPDILNRIAETGNGPARRSSFTRS